MWISLHMDGRKMLRQLFWTAVFVGGIALSYQYGRQSAKHDDIQVHTLGGHHYLEWKAMEKNYPLYHFGEDLYLGGREHQLKGADYVLRATIANKLIPEQVLPPEKEKQTLREQVLKEFDKAKQKAKEIKEDLW